jgi:hypothetical protein
MLTLTLKGMERDGLGRLAIEKEAEITRAQEAFDHLPDDS